MSLDVVLIEDAPHGAFGRVGQTSKACGLGGLRPPVCRDREESERVASIVAIGDLSSLIFLSRALTPVFR